MKDFLTFNLSKIPYFRALLRAVESRFYQELEMDGITLDLGCGDGQFAASTFEKAFTIGIDPVESSLEEAKKTFAYSNIIQAFGNRLPFLDATFDCVISNSVLEHIQDIDLVIHEIARILKNGGNLYFCVPNPHFTKNLSIALWLEKRRLIFLARKYRSFFNKISRHYHCDDAKTWKNRLQSAHINVIKCWDYFSPTALKILEWGHILGLGNLIQKRLFGRWVLFENSIGRKFSEKLCRPIYQQEARDIEGAYTFYICIKQNI